MRNSNCASTRFFHISVFGLSLLLSGCVMGPDYEEAKPVSPQSWALWNSSNNQYNLLLSEHDIQTNWWEAFNDPVLNRLQQRAIQNSPDLQTAALQFAQARAQRIGINAQSLPQVNLSAGVSRQRQSEYGAGTRTFEALSGDRSTLAEVLGRPFTLYQTGLDASWELDLWGRVSRSIEVADANIAQQAALLDYARLSLLSEVARNYLELRTLQQQVVLYEKDIVALESLTGITEQRVKSGVAEALNLNLNLAELAALKANLPPLQAQIHTLKNSLALLLGELPGKLHEELTEQTSIPSNPLPELALGLPSQVVNRRPDIRAAEHQLHAATANIGVATANLYPSISLGAAFGFESYLAGELADWGSRSWSIGPVLNLPLFDHGRLKSRVQLRELEQQQAAVNFHQTVLKAWKEVDDTLFGYASIKQKEHELHVREENAFNHYNLVQSRYQAGLENFSAVLMSERQYLQARMASNENRGQLYTQYVMINKAIGNGPDNLSL